MGTTFGLKSTSACQNEQTAGDCICKSLSYVTYSEIVSTGWCIVSSAFAVACTPLSAS